MNNTKQIIKEMKEWLKKYNGKFRNGDTFWEMFFIELEEKIKNNHKKSLIEENDMIDDIKTFIKLIK